MSNADREATPIRRQYLELKRKYADCILFSGSAISMKHSMVTPN